MRHYLSDAEVRAAFGDPRPYIGEDGTVSPMWPEDILTFVDLPAPLKLSWDRTRSVTRFRCHRRLVYVFRTIFEDLFKDAHVWNSIGDFGGCYAWRPQRGHSRALSRHCWAIAIDLDVGDNPLGSAGKVDPTTRDILARHGFLWGGHFKRPDPMHFEPSSDVLELLA